MKTKHTYEKGMSLREAMLVSKYGTLANTRLAAAALQLWRLETQLEKVEKVFSELIKNLDELRHAKRDMRRLWKFSGLKPDFIYRRDKALTGIVEAIDDCLSMTRKIWKGRCVIQSLRDKVRAKFDFEYEVAARHVKHGLPDLKRRLETGKVHDPAVLRLIRLTRQAVIAGRLRPKPEDHHPQFDIVLRPHAPYRYRIPFLVDMMPLSSPDFQEVLPAKDLGPEYQAAAKALGWKLASEPARKRPSDYCECGEPLERYQRQCEVCRFQRRPPSKPADTSETIGRRTEPSWRRLDRSRMEWSYKIRRADFDDYFDEELPKYYDNTSEDKAFLIGLRNQVTSDIEDVLDAQRSYGKKEWKKIKHAHGSNAPYHSDLGSLGGGQDGDPDDYEAQQEGANAEPDPESDS
jgi:hypothetical protein